MTCQSCGGKTVITDPLSGEEEAYNCPDCGGAGEEHFRIRGDMVAERLAALESALAEEETKNRRLSEALREARKETGMWVALSFDLATSVNLLTSDEAVEAFGEAWESTPPSVPGARRRAGLQAVADLIAGTGKEDTKL